MQAVNWGILLKTPMRAGKSRIGQRKKLGCNVATGEVSVDPLGSSRPGVVLQRDRKFKQGARLLL